jgi:iron complex outermembrane receptor protein
MLSLKSPNLKLMAYSLLLLSLQTLAAENTPANLASEEYYFQEMPVVLTASRLSQPLSEAPSSMTVIDREMINASGFRTVPDLMRLVPGMYVGFQDANNPVVTLNGTSDQFTRRMQILIDGRSVYAPPLGGVNWADLPLLIEDIERIEVVRGPSTSSHGANSFFGVINIITRGAENQDGGTVSATAGYARDASARFGRSGEKFDYRISVGQKSDNGIDNGILDDHNKTNVVNLRSSYRATSSDTIEVQIGNSDGVYGMGIAGRPESSLRDTTSKSEFQLISMQHIWSNNDESKLTYSHATHSSYDPYLCFNSFICQYGMAQAPPIPYSQGFTQQSVYSQRNELELQNTFQIGSNNRLVFGGDTRRDFADYPLFLGKSYTVVPWNVFAHDEWRITQSTIFNIGTMYEDDGMGNRNNSPQAALNYHLTPDHTVRFGISSATRSPAMGEEYMDANSTILGGSIVAPNSPLKPEKVISKEVGYTGEFRTLGLTVDSRAYIEQVSEMITLDKFVTPSYGDSLKNILDAEYRGVETTVKYRWNENHSWLSANYVYQQASVSFGSYPTLYFSKLPDPTSQFSNAGALVQYWYLSQVIDPYPQQVPKNSASLLLSQRLGDGWQLGAGYYWREQVRVGNVSPATLISWPVTPETVMHRLDLRLGKSFKYDGKHTAELAIVVQNATQDGYTNYGTVDAVANVLYSRRSWLTGTFNF